MGCYHGRDRLEIQSKTGSFRAARNRLMPLGWEAGIRTPIGGFRVRSLTVRRPPSKEIECTGSKVFLSTTPLIATPFIASLRAAARLIRQNPSQKD